MDAWRGPRYDAGWTFARIEWGTWRELDRYDNLSGVKIGFSAFDSLKMSGSLSYTGEPPDEVDAVSATYGFTAADGSTVSRKVATFLVESDEPEYLAGAGALEKSGTAKFYSLLKLLSDTKIKAPLTVPAGANAVDYARELVEGAGLRTNCQSSGYTLAADRVYKVGDTLLAIANDILDACGYSSLSTDAAGTVLIQPYVEPSERSTVWTFANDETSTIYPGLKGEDDWRDAPNVLVLTYETDDELLVATARNIDPDDRASLPNRGWRESSAVESVTELDGATATERLAALKEKARKGLVDKSSNIRYAKVSGLLVPVAINDAVAIDYSGRSTRGALTNIDITCNAAGDSDLKVREFVRKDLLVQVDGKIYV